MKPGALLRHLTGYLFGLTFFGAGIPLVLYWAAGFSDRYFMVQLLPLAGLRLGLALLIGIVGLVFILWSNLSLLVVGKGGPADVFGVAVSPRTRHLVTSGPYRYTRNPMAFGALLVYFGVAVFLDSVVSLALVCLIAAGAVKYLRRVEEKRLRRDFGEAFEQYRRAVPLLVPGWPKLRG
jgi:protein-S-isoprenylcysteine O-methyltransferase Ste14